MLVCLDTETTGLEPAQDYILELAMVAVETPSFRIVDRFAQVIKPTNVGLRRKLGELHPNVLKMHTENGLLQDLANPQLRTQREVEELARGFVNKHLQGERTPLMGFKPDFDRGFLKAHMPLLERQFNHRQFDVNALWMLNQYVFGDREKPAGAHRALADCEATVAAVHQFVRCFGGHILKATHRAAS